MSSKLTKPEKRAAAQELWNLSERLLADRSPERSRAMATEILATKPGKPSAVVRWYSETKPGDLLRATLKAIIDDLMRVAGRYRQGASREPLAALTVDRMRLLGESIRGRLVDHFAAWIPSATAVEKPTRGDRDELPPILRFYLELREADANVTAPMAAERWYRKLSKQAQGELIEKHGSQAQAIHSLERRINNYKAKHKLTKPKT